MNDQIDIQQQSPPQLQHTPNTIPWLKVILLIFAISIPIGISGYILGSQKNQLPENQQVNQSSTVPQPSPTPDPTTNWKTYINTSDKYSLKYPLDWTLEPTKGGANSNTFPPRFASPCGSIRDRCASLGFYGTLDATENLENYFSYQIPGNSQNIISKTEITLGGEKAIKVEYGTPKSNQNGSVAIEINIIHNKKVFRLTLGESGWEQNAIKSPADWKYKKILDQILSTLKFTDQNQTTDATKIAQ